MTYLRNEPIRTALAAFATLTAGIELLQTLDYVTATQGQALTAFLTTLGTIIGSTYLRNSVTPVTKTDAE